MSRLRSDRVSIGLCPDEIGIIVLERRLFKSHPVQREVISVANESGDLDWHPALGALERWLDNNASHKTVDVVLSNRFLRYTLVPASEASSGAEESALVAACFDARYGDMQDWVTMLDAASVARLPRIACAIPAGLLDQLRDLFKRHRMTCRSVRPAFIAGWNRWRSTFTTRITPKGDWMFAMAESNGIVAALARGGQWQGLRSFAVPLSAHGLSESLTREALLTGFEQTTPAGVVASKIPGATALPANAMWLGRPDLQPGELLAELTWQH